MKNQVAREVQGSILHSAQNCKESKILKESHVVLWHKGL